MKVYQTLFLGSTVGSVVALGDADRKLQSHSLTFGSNIGEPVDQINTYNTFPEELEGANLILECDDKAYSSILTTDGYSVLGASFKDDNGVEIAEIHYQRSSTTYSTAIEFDFNIQGTCTSRKALTIDLRSVCSGDNRVMFDTPGTSTPDSARGRVQLTGGTCTDIPVRMDYSVGVGVNAPVGDLWYVAELDFSACSVVSTHLIIDSDSGTGTGVGGCGAGASPPVAVCKDATVAVDNSCQGTVQVDMIDGGSHHPNGLDITLSVTPEGPFTAGNSVEVTLTASDGTNKDSCLATVSFVDQTAPSLTCKDYLVVPVDSEFDILQSLSDACSVPTIVQSVTSISAAGVWQDYVMLTATDEAGNESTCKLPLLVVYDPSAGFVTGGGWIDSPIGAYQPDTSLGGKASFGFVAKYKKGAHIPEGATEFQYHAAEMNFHSNSVEWLVVTDYCAKFRGSGSINGEGTYKFQLTACDNGEPGDEDTLRMQIWSSSTNGVVYDNKSGSSDASYDGTILGGGNIQVHKPKSKLRI